MQAQETKERQRRRKTETADNAANDGIHESQGWWQNNPWKTAGKRQKSPPAG
jgi:hypothetical protein